MKLVELGEIAKIDRSVASDEDCRLLPYVGLEHIEKENGEFAFDYVPTPETLLATKYRFTERHILYGKLRPYLNKVAIPYFDGVCTTEILPILPNSDRLDAAYLYAVLLSPKFVQWASASVSGANLPRLDPGRLSEYRLSLPPLDLQRTIGVSLRKLNHLRRTRRYAQQLSNTFLQSVFLEMFEEYLASADMKFKDILEMPLGNGVFEKNTNYGSGTQVIWVDNLYHTLSIDMSDLRRARLDTASIKKYEVIEGDLLFTRSSLVKEGIGQINIVPKLKEVATYECHTIRARVNKKKADPYYILGLYRSDFGRNLIMKRANTATMTTIGQEGIGELLCPLPPLALQQQFAQIVQRTERLRAQQREATRQAEHLFQTLLHQAFRGEA